MLAAPARDQHRGEAKAEQHRAASVTTGCASAFAAAVVATRPTYATATGGLARKVRGTLRHHRIAGLDAILVRTVARALIRRAILVDHAWRAEAARRIGTGDAVAADADLLRIIALR